MVGVYLLAHVTRNSPKYDLIQVLGIYQALSLQISDRLCPRDGNPHFTFSSS